MDLTGLVGIVAIAIGVLALLIIVSGAIRRYRIANPSQALIVGGRKDGRPVLNPETGESSRAGSLRSIVGILIVDEIIRDRPATDARGRAAVALGR